MRQAAQGGFYPSENDRHVGIQVFQYFRIDNARIVGAHPRTAVGRIGIIAPQAFIRGIMINHRIHRPGRNAEEEARSTELFEVAEIASPIRLGNDGDAQTLGL